VAFQDSRIRALDAKVNAYQVLQAKEYACMKAPSLSALCWPTAPCLGFVDAGFLSRSRLCSLEERHDTLREPFHFFGLGTELKQ
jgi:hypothetical protein